MHTNILFHTNKHKIVCRSQYALPVSTTLLRRCYYVNAVPTMLVLRHSGSYYVVTGSSLRSLAAMLLLRKYCVFKI